MPPIAREVLIKPQAAKFFAVAVTAEGLIMLLLHRLGVGHLAGAVLDTLLLGAVLGGYMAWEFSREAAAREKAELGLRESEARFQALVERSPVGIATVVDGRVAYSNPGVGRILGYSQAELASRQVIELVVPEDRPLVAERIRRRLAGEALSAAFRFRALRKDGSVAHIELFGSTTAHEGRPAVIGTLLDVSERVEAERERARSADIQAALNSLLALSLSPGDLAETLRRALELLLAMPWLTVEPKGVIFLSENGGGALRMAAQVGMSGLDAAHSMTCDGISEHGRRCVPIKQGDKLLGVINLYLSPGHQNDPREAAFLEAAARVIANMIEHDRLDASLRQSHKLEAAGKLAGGMAHDFNNLLTSILGCSEFIIKALPAGDPCAEDAAEIKKTAGRAADLTRQLLAFSRRQPMLPRDVDLNAVVEDSIKMLRRLLGESVDVRVEAAGGPLTARLDPGQLLQVLMNLAINAKDAMPSGGTLTIATGSLSAGETAAMAAQAPQRPHVFVSVSDTGTGMDEETRARVFEPFFTTKALGRGTGLGLAVVYGIVKQSGGEIILQTAPGRGSRFTVLLPAVRAAPHEPEPEEAAAPAGRPGETVLLAEDEEPVLRVVARTLREAGYGVLEAGGPERALEAARTHPGPIHLLLSDVVMPGMAGPDLARGFAPLRPAGRVLFMSGHVEPSLLSDPLLERAAPLLPKPFTRRSLLEAVRRRLDEPPAA